MRRIATTVLMTCWLPWASQAADLQERVAAQPGGTLRVDLEQGAIEVEGHDEANVQVDARSAGTAHRSTAFELRSDGRDVRLEGDLGGWLAQMMGQARVRVRVRVPRDYSLDLKTQGGAIEVSEVRGRLTARSSGGAIQVEQIEGEVDLQTSGGPVGAVEVRGDVRADTSGGPIRIYEVTGKVDAQTSGGSISIHEIDGEVRAKTSGGPISVRWIGPPVGSVETSGGSVEVEFSERFGADLDAETSGGRIRVAPEVPVVGRTGPDRIDGAFNGGGEPLRLRSSGGDIHVLLR